MLPTLLLGGFMFPIESMPVPPAGHFQYRSLEMVLSHRQDVMIKGLGFSAVWKESLVVLVGMSLFSPWHQF